ncbi:MAG: hypothetical protein WD492_01460 [Alkalispirochaeta sp.]
MADRSRHRGARYAFRVLLLTVAVFVLWRFLGPSVAVVRDGSLAPILEDGDIVWIRPAGGKLVPGTVVLMAPHFSSSSSTLSRILNGTESDEEEPDSVEDDSSATPSERPDALVPRIVAGLPGDEVTWTDTSVAVVRSDGNRFHVSPRYLHPLLAHAERSVVIPENSLFTISLSGGMIDSRVIGPRPTSALRYEVGRIVWPRERRGVLSPIESGRSAAP